VGFWEVGVEGDGLTVGGEGLVEGSAVFQGIAEVAAGFGIAGVEGEGPPDQIHGKVFFSHLIGDDAQQVQRLGMPRLLGQNRAVNLLGLWELA